MKRKIFYVCLAVVLGCITMLSTSCSEKATALHNLEELAEDVEKNGQSYGLTEWQDVFRQYQSITAIIDKHYGEYSQNSVIESIMPNQLSSRRHGIRLTIPLICSPD